MSPDPDLESVLARPVDEVGIALASVPEGQWFDRKSVRIQPAQLAQTEVALANAEGGTIVVGIHNGTVEGTDAQPAHRNELVQAAMDHTEPVVRARSRLIPCVNRAGRPDHLLILEVEAGETVHATARDDVYLRVGDENRRLTFAQRQELVYDKGHAFFDATPIPECTVADLDPALLEELGESLSLLDPSRVLPARGLLTPKGALTTAAYLLFARNPLAVFPNAHVRVLRYRGKSRGVGTGQQLLDDIRCEGPIPHSIRQAVDVVRELEPKRRALGPDGRFTLQGLVPEDVWLEGIVNAVVHRSYSIGGDHIRVEIFDDRIEIQSPGRFPGLARLTNPEHVVRFARNPRIARVCADLHLGQELGEGIRRMFREMRLRGLTEPLFTQTAASVRLVLSAMLIDPDTFHHLPPNHAQILDVIRNGTAVSTGDIADAIQVARPTAVRYLNALRDVGLIDWVGKSARDPRAYWRLHSE